MKETFLLWLNRLLVFDVFLVLAAFFWFAIGIVGKYSGVDLGFDLWLKLWQPLFNPAIGILMGGALLSWAINKINQRFDKKATPPS
ncbi:MAG: hypothetical protein N5P05_001248 [Chroococcopsis gigantea SAG 12.99]|jgi:hypothetical protein|nr:hypothetical protein [Chlorogloea purpurea SAG 13.99]MDV2999642.1 hypothetical protein [Chroococcopsis gigantea SAG 12.99]